MFEGGSVGGELLEGGFQVGEHDLAPFVNALAGGAFFPGVGGREPLDEPFGRGFHQVDAVERRRVLASDAPNATVGPIAAGIAEVDLAMLNDGVIPVGNINRAVWSHRGVDGTEGDVIGPDEILGLPGDVTTLRLFNDETVHTMAPEIVGEESAAIILG